MTATSVPFPALFSRQRAATLREKVCTMLRQAIASAVLPAGARLPSSRVLASDLALSRVTIEAAYSQLESEGYLSRHSGRGTFVAIAPSPVVRGPQPPSPALSLSLRGKQIVSSGGCEDPLYPRAFASGSPDLRAFPQMLWRRLTQHRLRSGEALMRYGDPLGLPDLRQAVAHYLGQSRGVRCNADQVVILTSSQQALQMIALLLCDAGDRIWMEDPGYRGAWHAFSSAGAQVTGIPTDDEGAVIIEAPLPRLVYLTPAHQYPTGVTMSMQRRQAWLAWAHQHQRWLVEDDYDSEFHYDGRPLPALQGLEERARVLYMGTFSKVLFPSLRLAYLVVPDALIDPLRRLRSVMDGHSAQLMQAVTADFIQHGHFAAHLRLMCQLYASRRHLLIDQLNNKLADRLVLFPHQGGLQLTVGLKTGGEKRLTQEAAQNGLLLPRLSPLYQQEPAQEGWLLGFSALQPAEIVQAAGKLSRLRY